MENRLEAGETHQGCDRLYVPSVSYTTGDLNVHDVVVDKNQKLLFINTDFSCLATLRSGFSFEPVWQPPFISKLVAEDRCHLNGLAMQGGEPLSTACSCTDTAAGWRNHRVDGGIVMHIPSNEIIAGVYRCRIRRAGIGANYGCSIRGQVNLGFWMANGLCQLFFVLALCAVWPSLAIMRWWAYQNCARKPLVVWLWKPGSLPMAKRPNVA